MYPTPEQRLITALNVAWSDYLARLDNDSYPHLRETWRLSNTIAHAVADITKHDWLIQHGKD